MASPGARPGLAGRGPRADDPLSLRIEALRVWWASYAFDGAILTPELIARQTELLADLRRQAERYEDLLSESYQLALEVKRGELARRHGRHAAIDEALAAKGLGGAVAPASTLLTAEHLKDGKVRVFSKPWRPGCAKASPGRRDRSGEAPEGSVDG